MVSVSQLAIEICEKYRSILTNNFSINSRHPLPRIDTDAPLSSSPTTTEREFSRSADPQLELRSSSCSPLNNNRDI